MNSGVARLRQLIDDAHRPVASAQAAVPSAADELRKFAELRDQGVLSEDEFQQAKTRILGGLSQIPG